jgi:PHD/YefM family antitoxin component YafN of YafNO toxin-antitoxin module
MLIKEFADMKNPEIWDLSETEDIIIIKENTDQKRVLIDYDNYKILKDALNQYRQNPLTVRDADEFDLNPHLEDLNTIVKNGNFKDITDKPHYFENMARKIKSVEHV